MRGYHFATVLLGEGSLIMPGNWWRITSTHGIYSTNFLREHIVEHVRMHDFPDKPSRMRSAFFCQDLGALQSFAKQQPLPGVIYEVEPVDADAPTHTGLLNCLPPLNGENPFELARLYWEGSAPEGLDGEFLAEETLLECPLRVLGQC